MPVEAVIKPPLSDCKNTKIPNILQTNPHYFSKNHQKTRHNAVHQRPSLPKLPILPI